MRAQLIESTVRDIYRATWGGYRVGAVNSAHLPSEIGNAILELNPDIDVAVVYRTRADRRSALVAVAFVRSECSTASGTVWRRRAPCAAGMRWKAELRVLFDQARPAF